MAIKYPIERRAEICSLVESKAMTVIEASKRYSVPVATIYTWLRQKKLTTQGSSQVLNASRDTNNIKDEDVLPPKLGKLDIIAAISLWQLVREHGADSPEVSIACRKNGIYVNDLLDFGNWINKASNVNAIVNCMSNFAEAKRYKQEFARSQGENSLLEKDLQKRDRALSELTTELLIRKKILAILS